jgi:hypothetical protein
MEMGAEVVGYSGKCQAWAENTTLPAQKAVLLSSFTSNGLGDFRDPCVQGVLQ